mmetsp:Transcript_60537/g.131182  ORF Transcript_60537/g.131182 Transcript_60537/m.131182 type:complete len:212 (+) Transcript_60537:886-1521(+)
MLKFSRSQLWAAGQARLCSIGSKRNIMVSSVAAISSAIHLVVLQLVPQCFILLPQELEHLLSLWRWKAPQTERRTSLGRFVEIDIDALDHRHERLSCPLEPNLRLLALTVDFLDLRTTYTRVRQVRQDPLAACEPAGCMVRDWNQTIQVNLRRPFFPSGISLGLVANSAMKGERLAEFTDDVISRGRPRQRKTCDSPQHAGHGPQAQIGRT